MMNSTGTTSSEDERSAASLTRSVYEQLRSELLSGKLRPGEKLVAGVLRERFGAGSNSSIREALNRLLAEGFVSLEEQKGFRVAQVSLHELEGLVAARIMVEGAAIRHAVDEPDEHREEELVLALHRLSRRARVLDGEPNREWERLHRRFHEALVACSCNAWMVRLSMQLFDAAERYRLLAAEQTPERNELEEHRAIVDACLARDAEQAVSLLDQHYSRTASAIADYLHAG